MDVHADGRRAKLRALRGVRVALSLSQQKISRSQTQTVEHECADARARVALVPAIKVGEIDLLRDGHDGVTERQTACALARERGTVLRVTFDGLIDLDG